MSSSQSDTSLNDKLEEPESSEMAGQRAKQEKKGSLNERSLSKVKKHRSKHNLRLLEYDESVERPMTKEGLSFVNYIRGRSPTQNDAEEAGSSMYGMKKQLKSGLDPYAKYTSVRMTRSRSENSLSLSDKSSLAIAQTSKSGVSVDMTCLKLENLNGLTRVRDIRKVFDNCVSITKPEAEFDGNKNEIIRTCYVLFNSQQDASEAYEKFKEGIRIDGNMLIVEYRRTIY